MINLSILSLILVYQENLILQRKKVVSFSLLGKALTSIERSKYDEKEKNLIVLH